MRALEPAALASTRSMNCLACGGLEGVPVCEQQAGEADDRRDGRAQLVRGGREEDRLQLVDRAHPLDELLLPGEGLRVGEGGPDQLAGRRQAVQVGLAQRLAGDDPQDAEQPSAAGEGQRVGRHRPRARSGTAAQRRHGLRDLPPGEQLPLAGVAGRGEAQPGEREPVDQVGRRRRGRPARGRGWPSASARARRPGCGRARAAAGCAPARRAAARPPRPRRRRRARPARRRRPPARCRWGPPGRAASRPAPTRADR